MKALGMIETYGLIGAIEAADVMLKVANVSLIKAEKVRGGLVNVYINGDVGAVKTAVEAGSSAVRRLGDNCFYSSHVIPRPDNQVSFLYEEQDKKIIVEESYAETEDMASQTLPSVVIETSEESDTTVEVVVEVLEERETTLEVPEEVHFTSAEYRKRLNRTRADDLRELIRNHQEISIAEDILQGMVRREMIALLMEEFEKEEKVKNTI